MVPLKFSIGWDGAPYTVFVSVYSEDGTVAIAHAGIEIGQGINTKVHFISCVQHTICTVCS